MAVANIFGEVFRLVRRTIGFTTIGLFFVSLSSIWDIMYGTGVTHPIWNPSFNWNPLIYAVVKISVGGALVMTVYSIYMSTKIFGAVFGRISKLDPKLSVPVASLQDEI